MDAWWTEQTAAYVGACGGAGVGILGGLFGTVMGVLAPRGKGKPIVLGLQILITVAGVAALLSGVVAVIAGQPYEVWYLLLLGGGISAAVFGGLLPVTVRVYRQAEQRRLEAEELRRS